VAALRAHGQVSAAGLAAEFGVTAETLRKDLIVLERQVCSGGCTGRHPGRGPDVRARRRGPDRLRRGEEPDRARRARAPRARRVGVPQRWLDDRPARRAHPRRPGAHGLHQHPFDRPDAGRKATRHRAHPRRAVRGRTVAEVGDWAARALAEINVDVAFLGTNGISLERGLTTPTRRRPPSSG
jgi:DeoR family fructose operon transcriptional repressor